MVAKVVITAFPAKERTLCTQRFKNYKFVSNQEVRIKKALRREPCEKVGDLEISPDVAIIVGVIAMEQIVSV